MTEASARGQQLSRVSATGVGHVELYPELAQLGVVGDRRTAAVISEDGTVRWLCLPDYDGLPVFASLLDAERGGYWRLGPTSVTPAANAMQKTTTFWSQPGRAPTASSS